MSEPTKILGIDAAKVGKPSNDGTRGSALYSVPLTLNQKPTSTWSDIFPEIWDHPPQWTTMHRPGIAHVSGTTIVLDGTTIEEVEKYHLDTLRLVLPEVDRRVAEVEAKKEAQRQAAADRDREHEAHIQEVADRLKFD